MMAMNKFPTQQISISLPIECIFDAIVLILHGRNIEKRKMLVKSLQRNNKTFSEIQLAHRNE